MAFGFYFPNPIFTPGGQDVLQDPSNPINNGTTFTAAELQTAARTNVQYLDTNSDGYIGDSDTDDDSVLQPDGVHDDKIDIDGTLHEIAELDRDGDGISNITYNGTVFGAADGLIFEVFYFSDGTHFVGFSDDAICILATASGGTFDPSLISGMHLDREDTGDEGGMDASKFSDVTCYALGTLIDTPDGRRAVEKLRRGDLVSTLDHGAQPVLWTHSADQSLDHVDTDAYPILIKQNAFAPGRPTRDLIVSPQHRLLVGGQGQIETCFAAEYLAPAKALTDWPCIRAMRGKRHITWVHFACARHEIVFANGCVSETLLIGPMVMNGLTDAARRALTRIYGPRPAAGTALNGRPARECLAVKDARRQLASYAGAKATSLAREISRWDADLAQERHEADRSVVSRTEALEVPSLPKRLRANM